MYPSSKYKPFLAFFSYSFNISSARNNPLSGRSKIKTAKRPGKWVIFWTIRILVKKIRNQKILSGALCRITCTHLLCPLLAKYELQTIVRKIGFNMFTDSAVSSGGPYDNLDYRSGLGIKTDAWSLSDGVHPNSSV